MTSPTAPQQLARRVDRLVRSLVGVVDLAPAWNEHGRLTGIDILKHADVQDHQLVRNVVSGLGAGCGIKLSRTAVRVHIDADAFAQARAVAVARPVTEAPRQGPTGGKANGKGKPAVAANGNGNGHSNGNGNGHVHTHGNGKPVTASPAAGPMRETARSNGVIRVPANDCTAAARRQVAETRDTVRQRADAEAARIHARTLTPEERTVLPVETEEELRLEQIHLERHGPLLRCRVILVLNTHRYSAIAEVPGSPTAEAELAARVTLDALRAGALTDARLEGVGFTTIHDTTFVAASIRDSRSNAARAGTAPLLDSMAHAATLAVLDAVGPLTSVHREAGERELGRLSTT